MIWERLSESYENDGYWPYPFILGCLRGEHDFDGQAKTTILPRLQRKGARRKALASLPGAARDGVISLRSTICALANPNCLIVSQGRSKVIQKLRAVDGNTVAMTEILRGGPEGEDGGEGGEGGAVASGTRPGRGLLPCLQGINQRAAVHGVQHALSLGEGEPQGMPVQDSALLLQR